MAALGPCGASPGTEWRSHHPGTVLSAEAGLLEEGSEAQTMTTSSVTVEKISADEAWGVFDDASRRILGLSADELVARWDAGERDSLGTSRELMRVLILRPSAR